MRRFLCGLVTVLALAGSAPSAWAGSYSTMYSFGDSFSDTGNLVGALSTRPIEDVLAWWPPFSVPGYADGFFEGRPTNGLSAVEHLAGALGIGLTNYAWTGALSGHGNVLPFVNTAFGATGLRDQVDTHLSLTGSADPDALYFVWGGHNDFWGLGQTLPASLGDEARRAALEQAGLTAAQDIAANVDALVEAGARNILVLNSIALEHEPFWASTFAADPDLRALLHEGVDTMNIQLDNLLDTLDTSRPALNLMRFDAHDWYEDTIAAVLAGQAPGGLSNAASACFDFNGSAFAACGTPDEYFFWDSIHLTTAAYSMLAGELAGVAAAPVPEPSAATMLDIGGVLLLLRRRRIRTATAS